MDDPTSIIVSVVQPARLVVENGEHAGMIFPMREEMATVGRGPENAVQIIDTRMSRQHTMFLFREHGWYARDLQSKNGTQVNTQTIQDDRALTHGDRIQVGDTVFSFEQDTVVGQARDTTITGLRVLDDGGVVVPSKVFQMDQEPDTADDPTPPPGMSNLDAKRLGALYKVADMIGSTLDLDELLDKVLDLIGEFLSPDRAGVLLFDERHEILLPKVIRRPEHSNEDIVISNSIILQTVNDRVAVLVADAPRDFRFSSSDSIVIQRIHAAICAPLVYRREVLGVLYLDRRQTTGKYEENDLKLVAGIANQAALAIANSQLHKQLLERHVHERELQIARSIQENLLPRTMPLVPRFEVAGSSQPARMVGGDYYDLIPLPDGRFVAIIADVSGKGVPAAILMSALRAAVYVEVRHMATDELISIVERLNQMICRDTMNNMFITMVMGVLDPERQTLTYCNVGHVHPILCLPDGQVQALESGGCFLGVIPTASYEEETIDLVAGSLLFMYSDGVTDLMNEQREFFGIDRLTDLLVSFHDQSATAIRDRVDQSAKQFQQGAEQFDDLTTLILRSNPEKT